MTLTFTGLEAPTRLNTGTLPTANRKLEVMTLLGRIANSMIASEPQCEHFAANAAQAGAANFYDTEESQEEPLTPVEFGVLLPFVGQTLTIFYRKHWREIEISDRSRDSMNGPGARLVKVESIERLRVELVSLGGRIGDLYAHIKVTLEGDYSS